MNSQAALFYENYYAALRDDCQAIEPSRAWAKVVGKKLFPEIVDAEEAGRRLADKLNPHRRDRLSDEQERLIMRLAKEKRGFSAALHFICDDIGFERPKALDPRDEALELIHREEQLIGELRSLLDRRERLSRLTVVTSAKSA
jgi:hypothetical protein